MQGETGMGASGREGGPVRGRRRWGPDLQAGPAVACVEDWAADLLQRVQPLVRSTGVPVQAVRADRVLSRRHLAMAVAHHARAAASSRSRVHDPGVDFLRYAAAERQIARAMRALGVPFDGRERPPVILVALAPVAPDGFLRAVRDVGLDARAWEEDAPDGSTTRADACRYWDARLSLDADVSVKQRERWLFAAMALVALED